MTASGRLSYEGKERVSAVSWSIASSSGWPRIWCKECHCARNGSARNICQRNLLATSFTFSWILLQVNRNQLLLFLPDVFSNFCFKLLVLSSFGPSELLPHWGMAENLVLLLLASDCTCPASTPFFSSTLIAVQLRAQNNLLLKLCGVREMFWSHRYGARQVKHSVKLSAEK